MNSHLRVFYCSLTIHFLTNLIYNSSWTLVSEWKHYNECRETLFDYLHLSMDSRTSYRFFDADLFPTAIYDSSSEENLHWTRRASVFHYTKMDFCIGQLQEHLPKAFPRRKIDLQHEHRGSRRDWISEKLHYGWTIVLPQRASLIAT